MHEALTACFCHQLIAMSSIIQDQNNGACLAGSRVAGRHAWLNSSHRRRSRGVVITVSDCDVQEHHS